LDWVTKVFVAVTIRKKHEDLLDHVKREEERVIVLLRLIVLLR
jgi:hypothetical protein